jgi:ABC-type Mn2+/Zn2+ transport system permease subunit
MSDYWEQYNLHMKIKLRVTYAIIFSVIGCFVTMLQIKLNFTPILFVVALLLYLATAALINSTKKFVEKNFDTVLSPLAYAVDNSRIIFNIFIVIFAVFSFVCLGMGYGESRPEYEEECASMLYFGWGMAIYMALLIFVKYFYIFKGKRDVENAAERKKQKVLDIESDLIMKLKNAEMIEANQEV